MGLLEKLEDVTEVIGQYYELHESYSKEYGSEIDLFSSPMTVLTADLEETMDYLDQFSSGWEDLDKIEERILNETEDIESMYQNFVNGEFNRHVIESDYISSKKSVTSVESPADIDTDTLVKAAKLSHHKKIRDQLSEFD